MEIIEFGNVNADKIIIQPVDGHDLDFIESEIGEIRNRTGEEFMLAAFKVNDWNKDLSPWKAPAVFGREDFGDGARATLDEILMYCRNKNGIFYIGGYSLAVLFSLWAVYQTDIFKAVAGVSPSVWFPGFDDYIFQKEIKCRNVYLSLGDREERTKNPVMAKVGDRIRIINDLLNERGVDCFLEWNEGNHFKDADLRIAKGFSRIISL